MHIFSRSLAAVAVLAGVGFAPHAASAATTTFGVDLSLVTANSDPAKTCAGGSWWYAENGVFLNPVLGSGSCQFTSSGIYNGQAFGLYVPASGTVTQARIKIGNVTGPMRINLVRTLFQQTGQHRQPVSHDSLPAGVRADVHPEGQRDHHRATEPQGPVRGDTGPDRHVHDRGHGLARSRAALRPTSLCRFLGLRRRHFLRGVPWADRSPTSRHRARMPCRTTGRSATS